ncbi:MAG: DUF5666 domain-containing protein [Blastocatellia bacterium]|nr:DUF5666 domain-containing protein [Blastocatellia bacterium]
MKAHSKWSRGKIRAASACILMVLAMIAGFWSAQAERASNDGVYELNGAITALPATAGFIGNWTVGGKTVRVTSATTLKQEGAAIAVGAYVEVKGTLQSDGSIAATRIEVKVGSPGGGGSGSLTGAIESLPSTPGRIGDWKVAGKTVRVSATTRLNEERGAAAVGITVEVHGAQQTDGSINATEIETKSGTSNETKFTGQIEELPSTTGRIGNWKISGRVVRVSQSTRIKENDGPIAIGARVKVEGTPQADGSVAASEIETEESSNNSPNHIKFRGTVETLPGTTGQIGDWRVSGRTVHVTAGTKIKLEYGPVAVNSIVEVEGSRQTDGSVTASEIEVEDRVAGTVRNTQGYCRFYGVIRALPGTQGFIGEWTIGNIKVQVTAATTIDQTRAPVVVGALVEGLAAPVNGKFEAVKIEVKQTSSGSAGYLRFYGVIGTLPAAQNFVGAWTVGAKTVHVAATTRIKQERGKVAVGAFVEVVGNQRADGSVDAAEVEVKTENSNGAGAGFVSFYATITGLPTTQGWIGDWLAGGKTIHVVAATKIEQERASVAVGALIEVKGNLRTDGSIDAVKIETKASSIAGGGDATFIEIVGKIEKLPATSNFVGDWTIDGRTVRVSAATFIKREHGAIAVGTLVEAKGALQTDGSVDATVIEVKRSANFAAFAPLASVSAANYQADAASESIIASFGSGLAQSTASATTLPLPTTLGGVSVLIDDKPAGLFFVSPTQINYLTPAGQANGAGRVAVVNNGRVVAQGLLSLPGVAPSLFTAGANGQGVPAGNVLRVKSNGQQIYEPLARFDSSQNKFVAVPIARQAGDTIFLVLYGTGLRTAPDSDGNAANGSAENVQAFIGNTAVPIVYAGVAPGFAGLDQLNLQLPAGLAAGADVTVLIKVFDGQGNLLRANPVTISIQ